MKIEIRQMEIVKEGTLIYALVPKPPIYNPKQEEREKELELLHLGEAELVQKEDNK